MFPYDVPKDHLDPDLWKVLVEALQAQLVLVLQSLVELVVPVHPPGPHVAHVEPLLRAREQAFSSNVSLVSVKKCLGIYVSRSSPAVADIVDIIMCQNIVFRHCPDLHE